MACDGVRRFLGGASPDPPLAIHHSHMLHVLPMARLDEHDADRIGRRTPAQGIVLSPNMPLMLFCTVRTKAQSAWMAEALVYDTLHDIWLNDATVWLVGHYVIMPDHLHFLCCPRAVSEGLSVEDWTQYWKSRFSKRVQRPAWQWQRGLFHHRIRNDYQLREKLDYIRDNPVTAGLVEHAADWPWQGCVHDLSAHMRSFGAPRDGG